MTKEFARTLRKSMTSWEVRLWGRLRKEQFGVTFRRQHVVGKYIADFACRPIKLIIEVDGEHHFHGGNDKARDAWLTEQGWRVVRVANNEVQHDLNEICNMIFNIVQALKNEL